ncbi:MAG: hypothetical protein IPL32_14000 [Chloracidobacterium sp.]|nr:hypothetical protein [Chloracidobacterium sp.]
MKTKLFAIIAIFVLALFSSTYGQDAIRSSATWQVQKYDLDVTLPQDERSRSIAVKAILNLKNVSGKSASTLTLRISTAADITSVKINDAAADFVKSEEKINSTLNLQRIATRPSSISPDSIVNVTVEYKINVKENSATSSLSPVSAQFLPLSYWYPTPNSWFFTQGPDTAQVRIKVNSTNGQSVVSSGTETGRAFEQKLNGQPFFVSGNWESSDQNGVSVFIPKGSGTESQKRAAEMAVLMSEARLFVAGIFGKAPDAPLRIIASRRGSGFSGGGTVIVDEAVFRRSKIDSQTAMNLAEATAKLWIGNSASVTGEGYGVITEGLSRFVATEFIENKYGKEVADVERLRQRNSYAAVSKRDSPMSKVSPLDDFYYPEVANKGAMAWRILAKRIGSAEFNNIVRANMQNGNLNLAELRAALSPQKEVLDYLFDQVTDMNLIVGLPQVSGTDAKSALRNTGAIDVTVDVTATTDSGQMITAPTTIKAMSFGEIAFKSNSKIVRVEIDSDKLYPQTEYSDDVKPIESTDSDPLLAAKRLFDKQDFATAESTSKKLLGYLPRFDDLRILLARSLLAQNKNAEAEKEFRAVLDERLPTSRSLAWANVGLGEIASRANQKDVALRFVDAAISIDADYGASLAARNIRNSLGLSAVVDPAVKAFFAEFDKAATSNRKASIDALVISGEVGKFAGGVSGSTEQWLTQIKYVDRLDANTVLVEAEMSVKLLNKNSETGKAVYRLTKTASGWKLTAVDMFEVR